MLWERLYEEYSDMPDSLLRSRIMSLENVGSGYEVVSLLTDIDNAEIRLRLIERAMELGAVFDEDDFATLDGEIPSYLLVKLAKYGNIEFGASGDVADSLCCIIDENARRALYERAYLEDVRFTAQELDDIGYDDIDSAHDELYDEDEADEVTEEKHYGCLWALLFGLFFIGKPKRNN